MILVDTSVLIHFFKGANSEGCKKFTGALQRRIPFGINSLIFQEVLQGAGSEKEYLTLKSYLETQRFYHLKDPIGRKVPRKARLEGGVKGHNIK